MSTLFMAPADSPSVVEDPDHVIERVGQPPVVITGQEAGRDAFPGQAATEREMHRL